LMYALGAQIQVNFFTGNLAAVENDFNRLAPFFKVAGMQQPLGHLIAAIGISAIAAWWRGDGVLARQRIAETFDFAEATDAPYDRAMALHYQSQLCVYQHDIVGAAETGARLRGFALEQGFAYLAALSLGPMGWASAHSDAARNNATTIRTALQALIDAGARVSLATQLNRLAEVEILEGDATAALATIERALAINPAERLYRPASLLLRGRFRVSGDTEGAEADFAEALALAHAMGAQAVALPAATALARLLCDRGDRAAALAVLEAEVARSISGCNAPDQAEARDALRAMRQEPMLASG
jgi:tetratricopeptide (TPR) repeat protein